MVPRWLRWAVCGLPAAVSGHIAVAQPTASLTGRVTDAVSSAAIPGAQVQLVSADTVFTTVTGGDGVFRFTGVPTGICAVRVQAVGHDAAAVPEVWVRAGRAESVDVALTANARALSEVEVVAPPRHMAGLGIHALTVEQSLRYPATFLDPARLASTRPGVAAVNDQANHLSVRGNGPASTAYLLEGAEIVCPNHLTNAGTASDLPTLSGGGVTILSAQMLGPSRLLTGGFGAAYGNALGGILDMRLRRGTSERHGFTAQAGLLGIDLSAEGPFISTGRGSYLVNYRYSTLGLLNAMGVDLGDEAIGFQDLSFHASLPIQRGSLSVFGLGGLSENRHDALADTAAWEFDKDGRNIRYHARMGAAGLSLALPLGGMAMWRTTLVASGNDQARGSETLDGARTVIARSEAALRERKLSAVTRVSGRGGDRLSYELGGSVMERSVRKELLLEETVTGWLVRPFAQVGVGLGECFRMEVGVAYAHYTANGNGAWEPRGLLAFNTGERSTVSLAVGQRSQLPAVQLYFVKPSSGIWDNSTIGPDRMQEAVLAFDLGIRPHLRVHAEAYHQQRGDAAIGDATRWMPPFNDDGSMVNAWDQPLVLDLRASGRARNTGAEASFIHDFHRGRYLQVNATAFQSTYAGVDDRERAGRWSRGFIANVIVGREFSKATERMVRTWGVNLRGSLAGGMRATPVDTTWSHVSGGTVHDPGHPFAEQRPAYHRMDLRVYLKREHVRRSGQWSLDLQNILNTRNEAYRYFDQHKGGIVTQYQLGLIPNISYRIEF